MMKDLVRIFKSPEGDVYHIALSEDEEEQDATAGVQEQAV